jgi:hypothetical protein
MILLDERCPLAKPQGPAPVPAALPPPTRLPIAKETFAFSRFSFHSILLNQHLPIAANLFCIAGNNDYAATRWSPEVHR